ncbi:MAG TPA: ABC transporter permease [Candidatus Acidoferrum sp.]|nr:ABC transporter permease [Candidatus Acidoferrum sp.]
MRRLTVWFRQLAELFQKQKRDAEFAEELESHLQLHIEDNLHAGMTLEAARRDALIKLGGLEQTKETYRDRRSLPALETMLQDLRYGVRKLRKSPGFMLIAVLTLALGIGANTIIFSMVNALLLHPHSFRDLDSLALIWENRGIDEGFDARSISPADAIDLRASTQSFRDIATFQCREFNLSWEGRIDATRGCRVSANLFDVLGVSPARGRLFSVEEEQLGPDQAAIISHSYWQAKFGGDPAVLGKTMRLSGRNYTIVGIMPHGFSYPVPMELWVPLALTPEEKSDRSKLSLSALARLKSGVTVSQASSELNAFSRRLAEQYPNTNSGRVLTLLQLRKELYVFTLPLFLLLQAAAAFVLLLACANLANLLFARMIGRQKELAVRSVLGASRPRLARLLVSEMLSLSLLGGAVAIAASFSSVRILRNSISPEWTKWVPGWEGIQVDRAVLAFAILLSVVLGILFGLTTVLNMCYIDLNKVLKETGRALITPARGRLRNALVSAQVTFALILLVCAGLTMQGFKRLAAVYQGFQPDHVLRFEVTLPESSYSDNSKISSFFQNALHGASVLPGVSAAALTTNHPASNVDSQKTLFTIEGRPALRASEAPAADLQVVSGDYFSVLRIPLLAGRFLSEADRAEAARVVVISQSMASRFWPGDSALGHRFKLGAAGSADPWMTVVGVVGDARQNWWNPVTVPVIYQPYLQSPKRALEFVLRVSSNPTGYASAARSLISQLDAEIAVTELNTLESEVGDSIAIVHIMGILMAVFGAVALLLSSFGLYGILSENVAQRTHEFGIRFALGAHPRDVLRLVMRHALALAGIGLAIGLPLALAVSRAMATFVFGIVSVSLPILVSLAGLLILVALVAAYVPARRAFRVDPMVALRYE